MNTETLFFIGAGVFVILILFIPGIIGILTQEFSLYSRGRNSLYKGQKAVVTGWGLVITSTCMLLGIYLVLTKNTSKNLYIALIVVGAAAAILSTIMGFFVEGSVTREK